MFAFPTFAKSVHIRLLSSCTSKKIVESTNALTLEDSREGAEHLRQRKADLKSVQRPAAEMYAGRQHQHMMRGIHQARQAPDAVSIELHIMSAFYGLLEEETPIVPYECTFSNMPKGQIRTWADELNIPDETRTVLAAPSDLILILLGKSYVEAVQFDAEMEFGGPTLFFCAQSVADNLPDWPGVKKVALSLTEAKRFSQGLVWIKGWMAEQILLRVARNPAIINRFIDPTIDICDVIDRNTQQLNLYDAGMGS